MKSQVLILALCLASLNLFAQKDCDIVKSYAQIFEIKKQKYGSEEYLVKSIRKVDDNSCFADLVNNNNAYIDYLRTNFSDNSNYQDLMSIKDTIELQQAFIESLQKDSAFNHVMRELTQKITDKNYVPDTLSMDDLLNIAVKFFFVRKLSGSEHYVGKICAGINGLKSTETQRQAQVEAFCFVSIFKHYRGEKFNMYNELVKGIKDLYTMNLGVDEKDRLLRAQGAMYMFMRHNETLREMLLFEYNKQKEYLPFVLSR